MSQQPEVDVIVIGAGMAGIAAALWCRRLDLGQRWFEQAPEAGGQLHKIHNRLSDYPGVPAENGRGLLAALDTQLAGLELAPALSARVVEVDVNGLRVRTADDAWHEAHALILATGVETRRLGVPGELELAGQGVSYSATRDRQSVAGQPVAVIGGGDAACENALLLAEVCPSVTLIHRRAAFRARPALLDQVRANPRITIRIDARVRAIAGRDHVESLRLDGPEGEETLAVGGVFVRIGVGPNNQLVARQIKCDPDGYVRVDADQRTSAPMVFAAGDVCSPVYSSLVSAAGQAMVAVKAASRALSANG